MVVAGLLLFIFIFVFFLLFFNLHTRKQTILFPYKFRLNKMKKKTIRKLFFFSRARCIALDYAYVIVCFIYGYRLGIVHCVPIDTIAQENQIQHGQFFFLATTVTGLFFCCLREEKTRFNCPIVLGMCWLSFSIAHHTLCHVHVTCFPRTKRTENEEEKNCIENVYEWK